MGKKAVQSLGFEYKRKVRKQQAKWDKPLIIKEIKDLDDKTYGYVYHNYSGLMYASVRHFGSWESAVMVSGFDYDKIRKGKKWTKEEVIEEIKFLNSKENIMGVSTSNKALYGAGARFFGSWENALLEVGLMIRNRGTKQNDDS